MLQSPVRRRFCFNCRIQILVLKTLPTPSPAFLNSIHCSRVLPRVSSLHFKCCPPQRQQHLARFHINMSSWDSDVVTAELRAAAAILNDCCLWQASKWAAEMCNGRSLAAPRKINPSGSNTILITAQICICLLSSVAYTYIMCASVGLHRRHARGGGVPGAAACPPCPCYHCASYP